jgi:D-3-phosphoglycerate dehydrogenase
MYRAKTETPMDQPLEALILQLLDWVSDGRPYDEVMGAWRTSCPRMPVWEEATRLGLLSHSSGSGADIVRVTEAGREFEARHGTS